MLRPTVLHEKSVIICQICIQNSKSHGNFGPGSRFFQVYMLLEKLNQVDRKLFLQEHQLEHELRMILNILMNFLVHNNDDPSVA